ncbi:MarR family winged helix-turn-helix transcriptional regulator [Streptomyces sp. NPDC015220]|uniref:MarR family winged helix-turn-helix transcriptional regulator n=1 Tax=Streptomyces sp. NPDC015220 TaxID=3364947 RepID=UPI003702F0A0
MTVTSSHPGPRPPEVARAALAAAELLEVLFGRASRSPVPASQLRALFVLEHNEGINLRTLAGALAATPPSASRLCDRLEAVGLVSRQAAATSRRELELRLSSRGRAVLAELRSRREAALHSVLEDMPTAQRAALLTGLEAFCAAASERLHDGVAPDGTRTARTPEHPHAPAPRRTRPRTRPQARPSVDSD